MMMTEAREGKWKHVRLFESQAQNWHTNIFPSFLGPEQVIWWKAKTRSHRTKLGLFVGEDAKSYG